MIIILDPTECVRMRDIDCMEQLKESRRKRPIVMILPLLPTLSTGLCYKMEFYETISRAAKMSWWRWDEFDGMTQKILKWKKANLPSPKRKIDFDL